MTTILDWVAGDDYIFRKQRVTVKTVTDHLVGYVLDGWLLYATHEEFKSAKRVEVGPDVQHPEHSLSDGVPGAVVIVGLVVLGLSILWGLRGAF